MCGIDSGFKIRAHLHLINEEYPKLTKTISVSLMNAYQYTLDNTKQSYYPPLKHSTICETPNNRPPSCPKILKNPKI